MSIVVGVAPGHPEQGAVRLGVLLARSHGQELVLVAINSAAWPPNESAVDGEYQRFLVEQAEQALAEVKPLVPADMPVRFLVRGAPSARRGLLGACKEVGATRLVVGSAEHARDGEIGLGSVSSGLLQGAELPVAIAPRGFFQPEGARLSRVTAAYSGSETSAELVLGSAAIAAEAGASFRIASFHTRPRAFVTANVSLRAEDEVLAEWERVIRAHTTAILDRIEGSDRLPMSLESAVGAGDSWPAALRSIPWRDSEVLVVGSSSLGPIARVSLGSHAVKIVRSSPVPVVVVPRRASEDYAATVDALGERAPSP